MTNPHIAKIIRAMEKCEADRQELLGDGYLGDDPISKEITESIASLRSLPESGRPKRPTCPNCTYDMDGIASDHNCDICKFIDVLSAYCDQLELAQKQEDELANGLVEVLSAQLTEEKAKVKQLCIGRDEYNQELMNFDPLEAGSNYLEAGIRAIRRAKAAEAQLAQSSEQVKVMKESIGWVLNNCRIEPIGQNLSEFIREIEKLKALSPTKQGGRG